jgi:hypothetical protein
MMSALLNVPPRMMVGVATIESCSVLVILFATSPSGGGGTSPLLPMRRHMSGADGALLHEGLLAASW